MTRHPVGSYGRLFPDKHIPVILSLIVQVGQAIRKKTPTDREDWITTRLHRRLIHEPIFRDGPLQIHLQPDIINSEIDSEKESPEGRLDLQVSCALGYEVYFAIEAKRLRVSLPSGLFSGGREYVKDGMMRFITSQYSPFMQTGAMLGYVYDGDKNSTRSNIDRQVRKSARELKLNEPKRLARSRILPDQPVDETHHDLVKRAFTIYHLLLAI